MWTFGNYRIRHPVFARWGVYTARGFVHPIDLAPTVHSLFYVEASYYIRLRQTLSGESIVVHKLIVFLTRISPAVMGHRASIVGRPWFPPTRWTPTSTEFGWG